MRILRTIWRGVFEFARELADENAYARYLRQAGIAHSTQSWKTFADQRQARKYRNPKCC